MPREYADTSVPFRTVFRPPNEIIFTLRFEDKYDACLTIPPPSVIAKPARASVMWLGSNQKKKKGVHFIICMR